MLDNVSSPHDEEEDVQRRLSVTVEDAVREHLTGGEILSVVSRREDDFDGDEVITVTVVVNAVPSDFQADKLASLLGKLRNTLATIDEYAFPMVSFLSPAEHEARVR